MDQGYQSFCSYKIIVFRKIQSAQEIPNPIHKRGNCEPMGVMVLGEFRRFFVFLILFSSFFLSSWFCFHCVFGFNVWDNTFGHRVEFRENKRSYLGFRKWQSNQNKNTIKSGQNSDQSCRTYAINIVFPNPLGAGCCAFLTVPLRVAVQDINFSFEILIDFDFRIRSNPDPWLMIEENTVDRHRK